MDFLLSSGVVNQRQLANRSRPTYTGHHSFVSEYHQRRLVDSPTYTSRSSLAFGKIVWAANPSDKSV